MAIVALYELAPSSAIRGSLGSKGVANSLEAVGRHTRDMLSSTRSVGEGHGDWQADKIHVANVGEDLGAVEGELAEAEVGVKVRIRGVCDGGFNESWARVKKEGQISVYGEPEAGTSETGNRHRPASTGSTERNGTVSLEGLLGGRRGVGVVGGVAIGLKEEDLVAVVNG